MTYSIFSLSIQFFILLSIFFFFFCLFDIISLRTFINPIKSTMAFPFLMEAAKMDHGFKSKTDCKATWDKEEKGHGGRKGI